MDHSKEPGIFTDTIMLVDAVFNRQPVYPSNVHTEIELSYHGSCLSEEHAQGTMKAYIKGTNNIDGTDTIVFTANLTFVGVFRKDTNSPNMGLSMFINNHAPAHMFPYVREFITSLSYRAGIPPIIIPPVNMASLLNIKMEADIANPSSSAEVRKQEP
jgi:preprotein translocase subunit SecB